MAALTLFNLKSASGAYLRRQRSRLGALKAISTTAHKLVRLFYSMLKHGTAFVDAGQEQYEERYQSRAVQNLNVERKKMWFKLVSLKDEPQTI